MSDSARPKVGDPPADYFDMDTSPNARERRGSPARDADEDDAVHESGATDTSDASQSTAGPGEDDDDAHQSVATTGTGMSEHATLSNREDPGQPAPASGAEAPDANPRKRGRQTNTAAGDASQPPASEDTVVMMIAPPTTNGSSSSPAAPLEWRVRAPCRDAPPLTHTVLRSVELWLGGHDPREVARIRRFDLTVTPAAVELHVLMGLQNAYGATADGRNLRRMADGFECWPSERDWKSIANGAIATGVDIYRGEGGREGLGAAVDWLGGPTSERWMWYCKIEAVVALTRLEHPFRVFFSQARDSKENTNTDELHLTNFPQDVTGCILPYLSFEHVISFSATSRASMEAVRRTADAWRKNIFFARIQGDDLCQCRDRQNVMVACWEDFPDARCAPGPSNADFSSSTTTEVFVEEPGDSSSFETVDPTVDVDSIPGTRIENAGVLSCSRSPCARNEAGTASSSSFEMLLFATDRHGDLLVANGKDSYGSFIAAGYSSCNIIFVIARRYLKKNDPRKKWTLTKLRNEVLADLPTCEHLFSNRIVEVWQTKALHVEFPSPDADADAS